MVQDTNSVNFLSRFHNSYDNTHYKYALRILKYLYLTEDLKLIFKRRENTEILDCFVGADWGGDKEKRKSMTGYLYDFLKMLFIGEQKNKIV